MCFLLPIRQLALASVFLCFIGSAATACLGVSKYETIDEAIARGDLQDVKSHLETDPQSADKGKHPKLKPLQQAILRKQEKIALFLIDAGADVNIKDSSKRTTLHLAVERNLPDVAAGLLKAKAKPDELDKGGWTPLHYAAAKNQLGMVKVLIEGGANPSALSERGGTPLHEAAATGGPEIIRHLLEKGVDPSVVSNDGVTALQLAREFKNQPAIAILEKVD